MGLFFGIGRRVKKLKCADPKDQVFALKGMLRSCQAMKVDYTKSVDEIYKETTLHAIPTDGILILLLECDVNDGRSSRPTWVPRFDVNSPFGISSVLPAADLSQAEMISVHSLVLKVYWLTNYVEHWNLRIIQS